MGYIMRRKAILISVILIFVVRFYIPILLVLAAELLGLTFQTMLFGSTSILKS